MSYNFVTIAIYQLLSNTSFCCIYACSTNNDKIVEGKSRDYNNIKYGLIR